MICCHSIILFNFNMVIRFLYNTEIKFATFFIITMIAHGFLIRLYGNTCGLRLLSPSSWMNFVISTGSTYCKHLNYLTYVTTSVIDHIWVYLTGLCITSCISRFLPNFTIPRRK